MDTSPILHSPDDERALLGALLIDPLFLADVRAIVDPSDFYNRPLQEIYRAICALDDRHEAIDILTTTQRLRDTGRLLAAGGEDGINRLITLAPISQHAEAYARNVKQYARRRALLEIGREIAQAAYRDGVDAAAVVGDMIPRLAGLTDNPADLRHIGDVVSELRDEIETALRSPRDVYGIATGFRDLDYLTGGLQTGDMGILSGAPGLGKSKLAGQLGLSIAQNVQGRGVGVMYFSLEMGRRQVVRRLLSARSGVTTRAMRTGRIPDEAMNGLVDAIDELASEYAFWVSDATRWTTAGIRAAVARMQAEHGVRVVVIDYLSKIADDIGPVEDHVRDARLATRVRDIARDLDVHILAIQRTNKAGMSGITRGFNVAGGAGVIFDADWIAVLNEFIPDETDVRQTNIPERDRANMKTLLFDKIREEAPKRYIHLVQRPGIPAFGDWTPEITELPAHYYRP